MDRRLRELERAWRTSGDDADGVAYLHAALQAGLLSTERLTIAAICDDAAATELLPEPEVRLIHRDEIAKLANVSPATAGKWTTQRDCPHVKVKRKVYCDPVAVIGWRRTRVSFLEEMPGACELVGSYLHQLDGEAALRAALAATWAAWLVCDDEPARKTARSRLENAEARIADGKAVRAPAVPKRYPNVSIWEARGLRGRSGSYLEAAATRVQGGVAKRPRRALVDALEAAAWSIVSATLPDDVDPEEDWRAFGRVMRGGFARAFRAMTQELRSWALAIGDPVAARVGRRDGGDEATPSFRQVDVGDDPRIDPSPQQVAFARRLLAQKGFAEDAYPRTYIFFGEADEPRVPLEELSRDDLGWLIRDLKDRPHAKPTAGAKRKTAGRTGTATQAKREGAIATKRPASLEGASGKLAFEGTVLAVFPRISAKVIGGERKHAYQGYTLRIEGTLEGEIGELTVGIGEGAQKKHGYRAGDTASGVAVPTGKPFPPDLHKASKLARAAGDEPEAGDGPPFLGAPKPLPELREAGYVPLATVHADCRRCIFFCSLPVESDLELVCYGPSACGHRPG